MKRFSLLWAYLFASLTLLSGCIGGPDLEGQPFFTPPAVSSPDKATVYFYRTPVTIGGPVTATIQIDGKVINKLPSGGYFKVSVPAGKYRVESIAPPIVGKTSKQFDINVENGKVYFIADQVSTSDYEDGQTLGKVDDGQYSRQHYYFRYALVPAAEALRTIIWCQKVPAIAP